MIRFQTIERNKEEFKKLFGFDMPLTTLGMFNQHLFYTNLSSDSTFMSRPDQDEFISNLLRDQTDELECLLELGSKARKDQERELLTMCEEACEKLEQRIENKP